jgi:hypothetical protein
MPQYVNTARRWLSLFFLGIAAAMMIWGHIVFQPIMSGWVSIVYWATCVLFAAAAVTTSMLECHLIQQELRVDLARIRKSTLRHLRQARRDQRHVTPPRTAGERLPGGRAKED